MGAFFRNGIVETLRSKYFGITIDETTDVDVTTQLGVVSVFWDFETGRTIVKLLDMVVCRDATGDGLTKSVFEILEKGNIPLDR